MYANKVEVKVYTPRNLCTVSAASHSLLTLAMEDMHTLIVPIIRRRQSITSRSLSQTYVCVGSTFVCTIVWFIAHTHLLLRTNLFNTAFYDVAVVP